MTGVIHISLTSPIPPCYLEFQFKGKEYTYWIERRTNGKTTRTYRYVGNTQVCKVRYNMMKWDFPLNSGGYSIPFTFQTPTGIPGSFYYTLGSTQAMIYYSVYGKLISNTEKLKGKTRVNINQNPSSYKTNINITKNAKLSTWCCSPKGILTMQVHWPQDTYSPSQLIECLLEIDNSQCKLPVTSVTAKLYYNLRILCNEGMHHFSSEVLLNANFDRQVQPGEKAMGQNSIRMQLDISSMRNKISNLHTTHGKLIECAFLIEVKAQTNGSCMCCGDSSSITSNFVIVPDNISPLAQVVIPTGWSPQIYNTVSMVYDSRYEVGPSGNYNINQPQGYVQANNIPSYDQIAPVVDYRNNLQIAPSYETVVKNSQRIEEINNTTAIEPYLENIDNPGMKE
ncbi:hypothetical protein SteCoe_16983 [Stentor coeruleus]|uniref:Uncharacterized protein n=1 Tax=Stentor coeruleus TaxID=5963 RepID=A0A1R2BZZ6_9CILI|nr:hypothetical protein SteCoe_16983 [Stentor coeruleus]